MKTKIICFLILSCILYGCVGTPDWSSMEPYLEPEITKSGLLKLEFDSSKTSAKERIMYDSITKNLFSDVNSFRCLKTEWILTGFWNKTVV